MELKDLRTLKSNDVPTLISFVVDNNPTAVGREMIKHGFQMSGISVGDYKEVLQLAFDSGIDINWLLDIQYIASANNWTSQAVTRYKQQSGLNVSAAKITWENVGTIAYGVLGAVLGMSNSSGSNTSTPVQDHSQEILGMQKELFYGLMIVVLIVIVLIIYLIAKKK